jgi:hypothetical protein
MRLSGSRLMAMRRNAKSHAFVRSMTQRTFASGSLVRLWFFFRRPAGREV